MEQARVIVELKKMDIAKATARRAKAKYGIHSKKEGAQWVWRLVPKNGKVLKENGEHLDHLHSEQGELPIKPGLNSWPN